MDEMVNELIRGAIDVHMHTAPDVFGRSVDDDQAASQAKAAGMSGILVKNHFTLTADRAMDVSKRIGFPVYGSLVLNYYVGGFNPHAVDAAIRFGAREIWMPTLTARKHLEMSRYAGHVDKELGSDASGLSVLDDNGELKPEVIGILEKIARADIALGTSHLSPLESLVLVKAAKSLGVAKIIVTHPEASFVGFTVAEMKQLANLGAMLEFDYAHFTEMMPAPTTPAATAQAIKEIGAEHCIMATDGGQDKNPPPVEMMKSFIAAMLEQGISGDEIRTMVYTNPRLALGVD
jgi:hypothetical protein